MSQDPSEIVEKRPAPADEPPLRRSDNRFGLRHLMALIVAFALLFWLSRNLDWRFWIFVLLVLPLAFVVGTIVVLIQRRGAQRDGLLWVMSVAAEKGMPLGPGVEAYAALCAGRYRMRTLYLAHLLEAGLSLPQAIDRVPGVLPNESALLVRVGHDVNRLALALRDASAVHLARVPVRRMVMMRIAYFCGTLLLLQFVLFFINYYITPKFEAIFADFGFAVPPLSRLVFRVGHHPLFGAALALATLAEFVVMLALPVAYFLQLGGIGFGLSFLWRTPIAGLLLLGDTLLRPVLPFRRRHTAAILRALSACAAGDQPLTIGLARLARDYPQGAIRIRLVQAYHDVEDGRDWCDALRRRGLIRRSDAAVLEAATRLGNLPWALHELAEGIERRMNYRVTALLQAIFPVIVLALGGLVLVVATAYFLPLIYLIDRMAA